MCELFVKLHKNYLKFKRVCDNEGELIKMMKVCMKKIGLKLILIMVFGF